MNKVFRALYPYILSFIPVFFFCSKNFNEFPLRDMGTAIFIVLIATFIIIRFLSFFKPVSVSSLLVAIFSILFFSYGPLLELISKRFIFDSLEMVLIISFSLLFCILAYFVCTSNKKYQLIESLLSVMAFTFLITVSFEFAQNHTTDLINRVKLFRISRAEVSKVEKVDLFEGKKSAEKNQKNTDVYYIILDMYPSNQVLKKHFNFDNSYFTKYLENKGFYVANKSNSNYPMTHLSLSSSLNFEQINTIAEKKVTTDMRLYRDMISNPKVVQVFKEQGYKFYSFSSGWHLTEELGKQADSYLKYSPAPFNALYDALIKTTMLRIFAYDMADQQKYSFIKLRELVTEKQNQPKFVFLHMYAPHPPFLFDKTGKKRKVRADENINNQKEFLEEVIHLNKQVMNFIDNIQSINGELPIIIIQGDHGTGLPIVDPKNDKELLIEESSDEYYKSRFGILNAYLVPKEMKRSLYPEITPVNSFRIVFSKLFNLDLPLLPDVSYYTWWQDPENKFRDVTPLLVDVSEYI
jgi:hypothetical protein